MFRASMHHTAGLGTSQNVYGIVEVTKVVYPTMLDIGSLSPEMIVEAEKSLLANIMLPEGKKFRPDSHASRFDLASAFVRSGLVPQYVALAPIFTDTRDSLTRNAVESAYSNPNGKLFYDAQQGGNFYPDHSATKLVAAIAFVKAANLDSLTTSSAMPGVTDASLIPAQWRGYVAVALQKGYLTLDGTQFNPNRAVKRIEVARAINTIVR
jgi:hypothetical protein